LVNRNSGIFAGIFMASILLGGCNQGAQAPASNNGVTEYTAILASIEAMRRDVRDMRGDIAGLKQEVGALKTVAPAQAAAAPSGPNVSEVQLGGDSPVLGADSAKVAIVEFTDYECPFCVRFDRQVLPRLKSSYLDSGKVKLITRDMPLEFHTHAASAALAAHCANTQGGYAAMRTGIFSNSQSLGMDLYRKLATDNKLDVKALEKCMQDPALADKIRKDAGYASTLGVTGTPTFFIGKLEGDKVVDVKGLVGALPYESFAAVIDRML
jgi:protein-disulfide isomerase